MDIEYYKKLVNNHDNTTSVYVVESEMNQSYDSPAYIWGYDSIPRNVDRSVTITFNNGVELNYSYSASYYLKDYNNLKAYEHFNKQEEWSISPSQCRDKLDG